MLKTNIFLISQSKLTSIITCITSVYLGILTIQNKKFFFENNITYITSFLVLLLLCLIKFKPFILIHQLQGFSLFIFLVNTGKIIMTNKINFIFIEVNNLSFSIYLYHHQIICDVLSLDNPTNSYWHCLLFSFSLLLIIICAKIHLMVVNSIINNKIFKKIESHFI